MPIYRQSLKSIVRAISIDTESPKLFVRTIPIVGVYQVPDIDCPEQIQLIDGIQDQLSKHLQLLDSR